MDRSIDRPSNSHTHTQLQIDCIDVLPSPSADRPPLIALASSRLEGSTWDGAISLLHAQGSATSSSITLTRADAIRPVKYGVPVLAWCGTGGKPMLTAARDDGDVEVRVWGVCIYICTCASWCGVQGPYIFLRCIFLRLRGHETASATYFHTYTHTHTHNRSITSCPPPRKPRATTATRPRHPNTN